MSIVSEVGGGVKMRKSSGPSGKINSTDPESNRVLRFSERVWVSVGTLHRHTMPRLDTTGPRPGVVLKGSNKEGHQRGKTVRVVLVIPYQGS